MGGAIWNSVSLAGDNRLREWRLARTAVGNSDARGLSWSASPDAENPCQIPRSRLPPAPCDPRDLSAQLDAVRSS
jgi:hypothetical protein